MKRTILILLIFAFSSAFCYLQNKLPRENVMPVYRQNVFERYNDKASLEAVRRISEIEGVETAVVMKRKKKVLAGVRLNGELNDKNIVYSECGLILDKFFSNAEKYKISVDDDNAEKIIELSYYLESDMKKQLLIKRFEFLMDA